MNLHNWMSSPEISARIAKIQTPEASLKDKNEWFVEVPEDARQEAANHTSSNDKQGAKKPPKTKESKVAKDNSIKSKNNTKSRLKENTERKKRR